MPPKRPTQEDSGRERKRVRLADARSIPVQEASSSSSAVATPGAGQGTRTSTNALPSAIDVEQFATARAFEIRALQASMASAAAASTTRAFQSVPRHLRRRAASHDVRRLPQRLREKAKAEMDAPKRKKGKLPQRGKSKRVSKAEEFARRQRDKTWLETHLYHAKRTHMSNLYGYRLPVTPTAKSYRPSLRAARSGSILHDASYTATLQLSGREDTLKRVLAQVVGAEGAGPGAVRYLSGGRSWEGGAYRCGAWPMGELGPVQVLWRPLPSPAKQPADAGSTSKSSLGRSKNPPRELWVRIHPASFNPFTVELQRASSLVLDALRTEGKEESLDITDLRGEILAFDIMGPKSTQVLRGALQLVKGEKREEFKEVWRELEGLDSPGSVPRGMCLGFEVYDPRLSYPPKNAKAPPNSTRSFTHFPSASLASSTLWSSEARQPPKFRKQELDARRAKQPVPGTPLKPGAGDGRVPVLLVQRSVGARASTPLAAPSQRGRGTGEGSEAIHGWTLLFPAGWAMAFLPSLLSSGTLLAGQRDIHAQAFEASVPFFPRDWVTTAAGMKDWEAWGKEEGEKWERRPRGKRVGEEGCWRADWRQVLGLSSKNPAALDETDAHEDIGTQRVETLDTQRESVGTQEVEMADAPNEVPDSQQPQEPVQVEPAAATAEGPAVEPWILRLPDIGTVLEKMQHRTPGATAPSILHDHLLALQAKRGLPPELPAADTLLQSALVHVRLIPCSRGCPDDLASIYRVSKEEGKMWRSALCRPTVANALQENENELVHLGSAEPDDTLRIGYVTSGNFSLQRGQGHALGAVALRQLLQIAEDENGVDVGKYRWLVKFRDRTGGVCWPARLEFIV